MFIRKLIFITSFTLFLSSSISAQTVKIWISNAQHGEGTDLAQNFTRQTAVLTSRNADIVFMQERSTNTVADCAPCTDSLWNSTMTGFTEQIYKENGHGNDGPSIWTKNSTVTVTNTYSHDLSTGAIGWDGSTNVDKAAVGIKATINGISAYYFNTHLAWSAGADCDGCQTSAIREAQITELISWINSIVGSDTNWVVGGDMNLSPTMPKISSGFQIDLFTSAGLSSARSLAITNNSFFLEWRDRDNNGVLDHLKSNPITHDTREIDYLFIKDTATNIKFAFYEIPDLRATCSVALTGSPAFCPDTHSTQRWGNGGDFGVRPSDHNWLLVTLTIAANCSPPRYCANTTLTPVTMPAQTAPALNNSFIDTVASKRITRITDPLVLSSVSTDYNNQRFQVSSGSEQNTWSKTFNVSGVDHYRYYYERVEGGTPHFIDWNGTTATLINGWGNAAWPTATIFPAASGGTFSYSNDGFFYTHDNTTNTTLKKFDFNAKTISTVKDWSSGCGVTLSGGHIGEPTVDVTDNYFSAYGGGTAQDLDDHTMVFKVGSGCRYFNTQTLTVGGDWGPTGAITAKTSTGASTTFSSFFIHNARLTPDGRYIRITGTPGTTIYLWDVSTTEVKACVGGPDNCFGHMGWSWTKLINQENGGADAIRYATRFYYDLSPTGITYNANPTISPAENMSDSHLTSAFSNAQQTPLVSCGAAYRSDGSPPNGVTPYTRQHRPFDNEIYCMDLTSGANATMFRFAHTFTTARIPATEISCSSISRSGSTISATCNSHGLSNGQVVVFTHTTSNALDGFCGIGLGGVTVTGANTFTCTDENSGTVASTSANMSVAATGEFNQLPRGNMSQDGKYYAFASDFVGQLGNTAGGSCAIGTTCRTDVFILDMISSAAATKCNWNTSPACN